MELLIIVSAVLVGVLGVIGSIVPVLPGPPLGLAALGLLYFLGPESVSSSLSSTLMWTMLAVTIVVTVLDYIVPAFFTKVSGGSKAASRGATVGMLVGIFFFPPLGMITGSFVGAFLAEAIVEGKTFTGSLKSAIGSFVGFLFGTGLKLTASGVMLYYIITAII